MHKDYHLTNFDIDTVKRQKEDFINSLIESNVRYSACALISSELNKLICEFEEDC